MKVGSLQTYHIIDFLFCLIQDICRCLLFDTRLNRIAQYIADFAKVFNRPVDFFTHLLYTEFCNCSKNYSLKK